MDSTEISETVLRFIAEKIESVPQLEALLLLWENPQQSWSEDDLARRLYVSSETAASIAQGLRRHQFARAEGEPVRYRYDSAWDTENLMSQVAAAYRRNVVRIATFIHSGPSPSVREFARAFNLKKDP